jgi:transposase
MDVYGRVLRTWMPAIHAGMTGGVASCRNPSTRMHLIFDALQAIVIMNRSR